MPVTPTKSAPYCIVGKWTETPCPRKARFKVQRRSSKGGPEMACAKHAADLLAIYHDAVAKRL